MTNDELKKKIVKIMQSVDFVDSLLYRYCIDDTTADKLADALIAAGLGDLKEHRVFAGKDGSIKQLYSGEEVEKIVKERRELKDELRSKVEYIQEQDEVIKKYKHRAEIAEKALKIAEDLGELCAPAEDYIKQAEKELAEERKDD